jgi:hypothetical protein
MRLYDVIWGKKNSYRPEVVKWNFFKHMPLTFGVPEILKI